jgi:pimeloyl-ACP methyl ester carboxylesterase
LPPICSSAAGSGGGRQTAENTGAIVGQYLLLSGIARFLVEFIRRNPKVLWGLSNAQLASAGCVVAGIALIVWAATMKPPRLWLRLPGWNISRRIGHGINETEKAAVIAGQEIAGTFKDEGGAGTFHLVRAAREQLPYTATDVVFKNGDVTLSGTMYIPRGGGVHPAIVMLQGSGPETRWGANRFWADYFGRRGIATLIYDKRGAGKSTGDWRTSDFNALAGDALAGVDFLQHQAGIDPKRIGIHGHSQGASIAPLVASQSDAVAFVLADAANAVPMWQTEIYSQQSTISHSGLKGDDLASADKFIERAVEVERSGIGRDDLIKEYQAALQNGQAWAKAVDSPADESYFWKFFPMIGNYNPADYWKRVRVPVLIVEAGKDERIPVDASVAVLQAIFRTNHHPDPRLSYSQTLHTLLLSVPMQANPSAGRTSFPAMRICLPPGFCTGNPVRDDLWHLHHLLRRSRPGAGKSSVAFC